MAFAFDNFVFDDQRCELSRDGEPIKVDGQVLDLLACLLRNADRLITKEELIEQVWHGRALGDNVISVCVAKLRKALGDAGHRCIGSVYGRGYRFTADVSIVPTPGVRASQPPPPPLMAARSQELPFVGRSGVMNRLQSALDRALAGQGSVCALLGEAGIGKTRAVEMLEARALAAGMHVAWGRCHAFGDAPALWPWLQMLGPRHRHPSTADAWLETLEWMSEGLRKLLAAGPWMLVLDDAQWADAASLKLLTHVVADLAHKPCLVVLTVRDSDMPHDPGSRRALDYVLGHRACERIELARLPVDDVATYTKLLFAAAPSKLIDTVLARSEGNPFFMVELLRPFADGPSPAPSALAVSGPALDIVRQALGRLSPETRDVLSIAAVAGRNFDLALLSALTQKSGEALLELLEDAMSTHVIVPAKGTHTHFTFGHDLFRSVLYAELASLPRARLHQRVAEVLSSNGGRQEGDAELAHHLLSALPSGDVARAVKCSKRAAQAAADVGAYADACVLLRRTLDALQSHEAGDAATRCGLSFALALNERAAGEPFLEHFEQAVALARRHGIASVLFQAGQAMSGAPGTLVMEGASEVLEAALAALPADDHASRAIVLAHMSWTTPYCTEATQVEKLLAEAERLLARANHHPFATFTVERAQLYYAGGPDDLDRVFSMATQMEQVIAQRSAQERGRWDREPWLARVIAHLQRGDFVRAQHAVDAYGVSANELRHAELIWHYDRMCMVLRMNLGDFEYAKTRLLELRERALQLELYGREMLDALDSGALLGQTIDITAHAAQFAPALRRLPGDVPSARAYKLRGLAQLGLLEQAHAELQEYSMADLRSLPKSRDSVATLAHLAFVSATTRSLPHAESLYEILLPYPHLCVASLSLHVYGTVAGVLGLLARALGRRARAIEHFEDAEREHARLGLVTQLARVRFELAQTLAESGSAQELSRARALLQQARADAQRLGMLPLSNDVDRSSAMLSSHP